MNSILGEGQDERNKFSDQFIRSMTGVGVEQV